MYKNYIFWATEFLNYMTLVFWGLKLFAEKYEIRLSKKSHMQNVIFIVVSMFIAGVCTINYKYLFYSNAFTYFICIFV